MKRKAVLLFIYNSFKDPLFQNILLSYIKEIQHQRDDYVFHVITFEQPAYFISKMEKTAIKASLEIQHIFWYPLTFHTGRFLLIKKLWDMLMAFGKVGSLRIKHNIGVVVAFANVSAAYSYILSKIFRMKLMIYSYEPHSEFLVELGIWSKSNLQYKVLKYLEDKAGQKADVILTGTKYMVEELMTNNPNKKVFRAPTGVDENEFNFKASARKFIRQKLNLSNQKVILYMGKFGDLYYKEEVVAFFSGLYQHDESMFFIIITRYPHDEVKNWFAKYSIPKHNYFITGNLSDKEIKEFMSVADMGVSAVPPSPSQKYRSPTKVGEYLMCGLPYITCKGVSEDDIYAIRYQVGVVVDEFSIDSAKKSFSTINKLIEENELSKRDRCREVGIAYRSKQKVVQIIGNQLDNILV